MFLPANTFGARHESLGAGSAAGTSITCGASNAKGTWTNIGSATSFAYEGITIYCTGPSAAADIMLDVGITDGTNTFIIVPDLHFAAAKQVNEHNLALNIPVCIPSGAQVQVRAANSSISAIVFGCLIIGHSANPGGFPGYSRVVALFTPATSRGIAVDAGASANTKGTWTQITSSCPADVQAIFAVVGFNGDTARAGTLNALLDIGAGASGAESIIIPNWYHPFGVNYDGPNDVFLQPVAAVIASGTRIAARLASGTNTAGDRTIDLALYGLVA